MAPRDPEKTARNKIDKEITQKLKSMLPEVLKATGFDSEYSLHGKIGGKFDSYIDIKNAVINSSEHFISLWLQGYQNKIDQECIGWSEKATYKLLQENSIFKDYLFLFLKRVYIRHYEALSKKKPSIEESEVWIGQENASYGILVTPRFRNGCWENDKSEIRNFGPKYWSIGHILKTGLLIPDSADKIEFKTIEEYLTFFKNVIVRNSGSQYEREIAEYYSDFVLKSDNPNDIPLLIPEFRYDGLAKEHKYRLDFTIIESRELNKIGFELSPWSSHGRLKKIKQMTQKDVNKMASGNFDKEMRKHKDYFKRYGLFVLIYTDSDLINCKNIFEDMKKYLLPKSTETQLKFYILDDFFNNKL